MNHLKKLYYNFFFKLKQGMSNMFQNYCSMLSAFRHLLTLANVELRCLALWSTALKHSTLVTNPPPPHLSAWEMKKYKADSRSIVSKNNKKNTLLSSVGCCGTRLECEESTKMYRIADVSVVVVVALVFIDADAVVVVILTIVIVAATVVVVAAIVVVLAVVFIAADAAAVIVVIVMDGVVVVATTVVVVVAIVVVLAVVFIAADVAAAVVVVVVIVILTIVIVAVVVVSAFKNEFLLILHCHGL